MSIPSDNNVNVQTKSELKDRIKLAIMIAFIYFILILFGAGCPIKFLTGISCPGCGMTRAVWAAIHLQFHKAFHYHPLFGLVPLMFALYLFGDKLKPHHAKYIWIMIFLGFVIVYLVRLSFIHDDIVSIDISSGFVLKFLHNNILGG